MVFETIQSSGQHEQVVFCNDKQSGLKGIIAIHNTHLGPALGGCRMWPYKTEEEALKDVLNLSRSMSYKSAITGLKFGGGKSVIIGDPDTDKNPRLFQQFGRYVESLKGRYIAAKDVGINENDIKQIGTQTSYVVGRPKSDGGVGDPSYCTALGVYHGIQMAVKWKLKKENLKGVRVTLQGIGSVGHSLTELLVKEGAEVILSDIKQDKIKKLQSQFPAVKSVSPEDIFSTSCDVFAPCALGGQVSEKNFKNFDCQIVAGAANNQLESADVDDFLYKKGILYVPDFIINSGGLIYVCANLDSSTSEWIESKMKDINRILLQVFGESQKKQLPTEQVALNIAKKRIQEEDGASFYTKQ